MDPKMVDIKKHESLSVPVENIQPRRQYFPQVPKLSAKYPSPPQCKSPLRASELRTSKLYTQKRRELQHKQTHFFEHVLFLCEVFVPPRRD